MVILSLQTCAHPKTPSYHEKSGIKNPKPRKYSHRVFTVSPAQLSTISEGKTPAAGRRVKFQTSYTTKGPLSPEAGPHQTPSLRHPELGHPSLQNWEK